MKIKKSVISILILITFGSVSVLGQSATPTKGNSQGKQVGKLSPEMMEFLKSSKGAADQGQQTKSTVPMGSWQTSWDAFLRLVEQELDRLPPNAAGPWDGKEVTWEGTVRDMEMMMSKNLVRFVFDMPERALSVKDDVVTANRLMIFVPMTYENLAAAQKGAKVRFKTTIAPVDTTHPAVSARTSKESGKTLLMITTKGGAILK